MHDAATLESRGVPTAPVVTTAFVEEAHLQRAALGMDDLEPAVVAHPVSTLSDEQLEARARQAAPQVLRLLTGTGPDAAPTV